MKPIIPPISPGDSGEAVPNLQDALRLLIESKAITAPEPPNRPTADELQDWVTTLATERAAQFFGEATREIVFLLQRQRGLGDSLNGTVEQRTAELLNSLVRPLQPPDKCNVDFVVEGRVVDEQGRGLACVQVSLFDEDLTGPTRLGGPVLTAADGSYRFVFRVDDFLDGDVGEVQRQPMPRGRQSGERFFLGAMLTQAAPVTVRIPSGPDLWAGVGAEAQDVLARTEIVFNATPRTQVPDLVLARSAQYKGLSDLERVAGLVKPRLRGMALEKLSAAQCEFLARDCEEPLALVKALVAAARSDGQARTLAEAYGLAWPMPAEVLVPALQFTVSADRDDAGLDQLLAMRDEDVVRLFEDGISRNRIPKSIRLFLQDFAPWFAELRARHRLAGQPGDRTRSLGPALATLPDGSRLKDDELVGVARAMDFWGSDSSRFAAELQKAGLTPNQAMGVVRTISLDELTGGHVPLIKLLQIVDPKPEHAGLLDLASFDRKAWTAYAEKAGLPAGVGGTGAYVTGLLRGMEQRAPTAYMLARMADGRIAFDSTLLDPARAFASRNPDFRFGTDSVFARFGQSDAVSGIQDDQVPLLLQELLRVERIARAAPNLEAAEIVLGQGYGSALEIAQSNEDEFVGQMKDLLPGGEAEARATYAGAQGITETAFALFLALSPQANGQGQVKLLSGSAQQGAMGTGTPAPMVTRSAMTTPGSAAQAATLEVLFGNQDACACDACSAMGSPSHYFTELLMLLDRGKRNTAGTRPLEVLLHRRPDLQEIELDCDNAGRTTPYVDLLLELLEAPLIEQGLFVTRVVASGNNPGTDPYPVPNQSPPTLTVPPELIHELRESFGLDLGPAPVASQRSTQPPQAWVLRGGGLRLLLTVVNQNKYTVRLFPQSRRVALPESWGYPAQMLDAAYAQLASARYPWTLPFDLAEAETDAWLGMLGSSVRAVGELEAGPSGPTSDRVARLTLGMTRGEWDNLTAAGSTAAGPWLDWGFKSTEPWEQNLRTVSTFKLRAGISHLQLLELIQCRFVQPGQGPMLTLSGDECDSDSMFLGDPAAGSAPLDAARLRRIHVFLRLWRRTGWTMRDLDRAIAAFPQPTLTSGSQPEAFSAQFMRHLAALVRLCEQTRLDPELVLAVFSPVLDTRTYWRQEGTRAFSIPSTYDRLFSDPALNRPRSPAFELDGTRTALVRVLVTGEVPKLRLSDHVAVIAGALGATAADVLALLPRGEDSIAATNLSAATTMTGKAIEVPASGEVVVEVVVGPVAGGSSLAWLIQQSSDGTSYTDIPASDFVTPAGQAINLSVASSGGELRLFRYQPSGTRARRLRIRATASGAAIPIAARVLTETGLVTDELILANLSLLTRHLLMARACKLTGVAYRRLLELLNANAIQSPVEALKFLEQLRRLQGIGLSVDALDELLCERFADRQAEQRAQARVCEALEALRAALAAQEAELVAAPGQAEFALRKALLEAGWPQRLVDLVVSPDLLDPDVRSQHETELKEFPGEGSYGLSYDAVAGKLKWSWPADAGGDPLSGLSEAGKRLLSDLQTESERSIVSTALDSLSESVALDSSRDKHEADLDQLPPGLPHGLTYDAENGKLRWSWPVTDTEEKLPKEGEKLLKLYPVGTYQHESLKKALEVLTELVSIETKRVRGLATRMLTLCQSFELPTHETDVKPQDADTVRQVRIPDSWTDALWFDAGHQKLCFKGPMTEGWRDELKALSSAQPFDEAIDRLFQTADAFREAAGRALIAPATDDAAYAWIVQTPRGLQERAGKLLERVWPMLRVRRASLRVQSVLEPRLGLAAPIAAVLLHRYRHNVQALVGGQGADQGLLLASDFVRSPAALRVTPLGFPLQYAALRRLFKLAGIASGANLQPSEAAWLFGDFPGSANSGSSQTLAQLLPTQPQTSPPGSDLRTAWERWTTLLAARQRLGNSAGALDGYIRSLDVADLSSAVRALAAWAGTSVQDMQHLMMDVVGAETPADRRDPARLLHLAECLSWLRATAGDAASLRDWSNPTLGMAAAARARQLARAKVGEAGWAQASRKPLDQLRLQRRDALVAYEVHRRNLANANALYGELLVDPEMGPCMMTTRTRLAISSAQLFVQRILLGLERDPNDAGRDVSPSAINRREWDWMQSYRMWEANLKVLLNSENYIDMSLRREKTPPYRALEADLMQGDVSAARASAALATYLDELEEVSRLQTVGMYRDTPMENGWPIFERQTLYFVGATQTQPKKHFLRRYVRHGGDERDGTWTPWKRIDLDLQDTYTVSPVVRNGEVTLFWLEFREEAEQRLPSNSQTGSLPTKFWVPTLRWSFLSNGKWASPLYSQIGERLQNRDAIIRDVTDPGVHEIRVRFYYLDWAVAKDWLEFTAHGGAALSGVSALQGRFTQLRTDGFHSNILASYCRGDPLAIRRAPLAAGGMIPVFGDSGGARVAFSHQDVPDWLCFRAPMPATWVLRSRTQDDDLTSPPLAFVLDTGNGELLAQPRYEEVWSERRFNGERAIRSLYGIGDGEEASAGHNSMGRAFVERLVLSTNHHPQVGDFRRILRTGGLSEFLSLRSQRLPAARWYGDLRPDRNTIPSANDPKLDVDFDLNGSYSLYNWELFFMLPFAVANELSKQQRFREAREWFHYVFDPTSDDDSAEPGQILTPGQQVWKFRPFRTLDGTASIQRLVRDLADSTVTSAEKTEFLAAIGKWRQDPFDPHLVARFRPVAYQMAVVMAYIKNLIAWGDQLFRRDTMESLNEASQLYVLAAEILGPSRDLIPPRTRPLPQAFVELKAAMAGNAGATALSNPLVAAEGVLPSGVPGSVSRNPLPKSLQFCVPPNPAFEELRQTVQDRLFKLRNCMNIEGMQRQLALFEPPIDPAMLVRARAAGVDVATLLSETSAPPPLYRFQVLAQKASEVCADVKSLGAALLAALEKSDAEALSRLRSEHESQMLASVRQIKQLQIDEAEASIRALDPSLEAASRRLNHYLNLLTQVEALTVPTGPAGPTPGSLLVSAVKTVAAVGSVATVITGTTNPVAAAASVALNQAISRATEALANAMASNEASSAKVPMNPAEKNQLVELQSARESQNKANDLRLVAQLFAKIPDFKLGASGIASPVVTAELGGSLLSSAANFLASMEDARASEHSYRANLHSMLANYQRRAAEWMQQALQANSEIEQITRQMASAALRAAIAEQDLRNHDQQIAHAAQVDDFMRSKWTNQELYSWTSQQVSGVYLRSYQLAYDLAKRAERAYKHELGLEASGFVRSGHWDGLKMGLLAGELLYHDIKRMEAAYLDANAREFEITRTISLRQVDAAALMTLRVDGQCEFSLPEWLFNMDYPDHWLRRIKSVAVTLPCVVGPYAGIGGTLTLLSSKVRRSPTPSAQGYGHESNFRSSNAASSSVAISTAQGDSGLFEFNLRDERFLPFEGAGLVDSQWRFALPQRLRPFDYETISDLVLTIRYTARPSSALRQEAQRDLDAKVATPGSQRLLIDLKRDFPSEWARRTEATGTQPTTTLAFKLERRHFPYAFCRSAQPASDGHQAWLATREGRSVVALQPVSTATPSLTLTPNNGSWDVEATLPSAGLNEAVLLIAYDVQRPLA